MQKTNKKASILLWSIFLSLIISVSFISINSKINKNLKENSSLTDNLKTDSFITNIIHSWSIGNTFLEKYNIDSNKDLVFDKTNEALISLKKDEIHNFEIIENSSLTIEIISWGVLKFNNEIISSSKTFNVFPWNLEILNIWWFTRFKLISDSDNNYLSQYRNYKVVNSIWNKKIIKEKWKIKNF